MLTNNSDPKTNIPIRLIDTSKRRKIANIDLFRDNDNDNDTTVVIFIAFIFSYLLIYFVLKHIYISLGNNAWIRGWNRFYYYKPVLLIFRKLNPDIIQLYSNWLNPVIRLY